MEVVLHVKNRWAHIWKEFASKEPILGTQYVSKRISEFFHLETVLIWTQKQLFEIAFSVRQDKHWVFRKIYNLKNSEQNPLTV